MRTIGTLNLEYSLPRRGYPLCRARIPICYSTRVFGKKVLPFRVVHHRVSRGRSGAWILVVNSVSDGWREESTDETAEAVLRAFGVREFNLLRWSLE